MASLALLSEYHIITALVSIFAAWKWGDWRGWKKYYSTILFYLAGDLLYHSLTYDHVLWDIESPLLRSKMADLIHKLSFFPATILIFLPHFPKEGLGKRILYVLMWVFIYSTWELIASYFGYFSYHNGWSIKWSLVFNLIMFPLLLLHQQKPLYAIAGAFIIAYTIIKYFNVPI